MYVTQTYTIDQCIEELYIPCNPHVCTIRRHKYGLNLTPPSLVGSYCCNAIRGRKTILFLPVTGPQINRRVGRVTTTTAPFRIPELLWSDKLKLKVTNTIRSYTTLQLHLISAGTFLDI